MPVKNNEDKITPKMELFCQEYVANGYKLTDAYCKAYPNSNKNSANKSSWRLINNPAVKRRIDEIQHARFEALHLSADKIMNELDKIASSEKTSENGRLKALELLGKFGGLDKINVKADVNANIVNLTIGDEEEDGD